MNTPLILVLGLVPTACLAAAAGGNHVPPSAEKAEMMGRVEWISMQGARDVTARKSIEWGNVENHENGNRSIRYKYYATIWDRDIMMMNQVFTFDPAGNLTSMRHVEGFPKKMQPKKVDTSTQHGMIDLVEVFFRRNFRDMTRRKTLEWGPVIKDEKGNPSIRYKYEATIWDKDTKVVNQLFTFDPSGKFLSVSDVKEQSDTDQGP